MLNSYQTKLYNDLFNLAYKNEAFYYSDFRLEGANYRIFLHRLASYTDFLEQGALDSRGTMFEMQFNTPSRLVSFPFSKFWNWRENEFTMNPDWGSVVAVEDKRDGSLMSTYLHITPFGQQSLRLKSKGSIASEQSLDAMDWLNNDPEGKLLERELYSLDGKGYCTIMEWTAPNNRIVLGYEKPSLTILAVRNLVNGKYIDRKDLMSFEQVQKHWVDDNIDYVEKEYGVVEDFVEAIADMENIEGYVLTLDSGQRIKIKTNWYLTRHRNKDSVNCPRRLFEAVLDEATDDLRTLFFDDPVALKQIEDMEKFAENHYNHSVDQVERFYERNKHMERKEYAILGQKELSRPDFNLAMMKYVGKEPNYKEAIKKRWRELGLKDEVQLEEGEE